LTSHSLACSLGWGEIYPEGLYRCLKRLQAYDKPLYITEIGLPDNEDSKRPSFLVTHLHAAHRAVREGIPVKGVYFWSLVDNFEWAEGFSARFGLAHLDLETKERRLKRSGRLYAAISRAGSLTAEEVAEFAPEVLAEVLSRE
jgi:beta-glucosidase